MKYDSLPLPSSPLPPFSDTEALSQYVLEEFRSSAIPDALTLANVTYIDGDAAVQVLTEAAISGCQKVASYVTVEAKRILDRYQFAAVGGWLATGTNLEGTAAAEIAYFKPRNPR